MGDNHTATSIGTAWSASFNGAALPAMEVYDELMVPRLFGPWATLLVNHLAIAPRERVLDVACGPGVVARIAAKRVGAGGRVTGCDLSAAMLSVARTKPPVEGGCPIRYLEGPADELPVAEGAFDVVTCQQGLQFFADRRAAVAEMHRALRPGGRLGIAVWASIDRSPAFAALASAIEEVVGAELAARYRGGPFGLPEPARLGELLANAGFDDVRVSKRSLPLVFEGGAAQLVATLAATPLAAEIDWLPAERRDLLLDSVARATGCGAIESEIESNLAFARVPLKRVRVSAR